MPMSMRNDGFTLLEVLVSLAILSIAYGLVLQIIGSSSRQAARTAEYRAALAVAESQLELATTARDFERLPRSGKESGKYAWEVDFEPTTAYDPAGIRSLYTPIVTRVRVEWGESTTTRHSIELATIRLQGVLR